MTIGACLREEQQASGGVAGYMGGDDFGIILPDRPEVLERLQDKMIRYAKVRGGNAGFQPAFGIYPIVDRSISVSTMYDRAVIALGEMKGNYARRSCRYDSRMKRKMEENHMLLSEVQRALEPVSYTHLDMGVKLEFLDSAPPLQDCFTDFLQRKKSGL